MPDILNGMLSEICFFSVGDSKNVSTFSGIPFFFSRELENRGVVVNRVNIAPPVLLSRVFNALVKRVVHLFNPHSLYDFSRSWLYDVYVRRCIIKANKKYPNSELALFVTFCANNRTSTPNVLLGDWTFEYLKKVRSEHGTDLLENIYIRRENKYIEKADLVITLFPHCEIFLDSKFPNINVKYLGVNVVNNYNHNPIDEKQLICNKKLRKKILFIGRSYYQEGLNLLIDAFDVLRKRGLDLELHIVGFEKHELAPKIHDNMFVYGYLRKDVDEERDMYYKLLSEASMCVNPTSKWAGYSSMIEAMYYYTPIITSPYNDFVKEFGEAIEFGCYYDGTVNLASLMLEILNRSDEEYMKMCKIAHKMVATHTWGHYVDLFLAEIEQLKK